MFTEFPTLLDEVYGDVRFCFIKVFSELNGKKFWDYQAEKQLNIKMAHFIKRDFWSSWSLACSKE